MMALAPSAHAGEGGALAANLHRSRAGRMLLDARKAILGRLGVGLPPRSSMPVIGTSELAGDGTILHGQRASH